MQKSCLAIVQDSFDFCLYIKKLPLCISKEAVENQCFFQVDGIMAISKGNTSSRPKIMAMDKRIFEASVKSANEPAGPTIPKPGPTLLKHVTEAVNNDSKSKGSRTEMIKNTARIKIMYTAKYVATLR